MPIAGIAATTVSSARRCVIAVNGVVQGVGLRPSIYQLAVGLGLSGSVRNTLQGVLIEVQGAEAAIHSLLEEVRRSSPRARIAMRWEAARALDDGFSIEPSECDGIPTLSPTPDLATCDSCRSDLAEPGGRRRGYAFTTCAACGPRFTIVRSLPYDRHRTTMAGFAMCARCRAEYEGPADRRFHAETICCPTCGPTLLLHRQGEAVRSDDPIGSVAHAMRKGAIVAIKGIGGYHLACDATNAASVSELRRRKRRDAKPLALMVKDLDAARAVCELTLREADVLGSAARPIVLATTREESAVAAEVAPGMRHLGLMLPYTPLHHLLLDAVDRPLVMTSGNASDEPIAYTDEDALGRLGNTADLVATHDRPIHVPCDDSVAQVVRGVPRLLRRSRGYVPEPITLPVAASVPILACGGELKSTVALARGNEAFLSQHLGDLTSEGAFREYLRAIGHLQQFLVLTPGAVVHDGHPAYRSTLHARSLEGIPRLAVQHHHAHIASCLAENGVDRRVIGVAWDGSGHGLDGTVWGGEFLVADLSGFTREGHLETVPLPGGETAIRQPWRMAATFLRAAYGEVMDTLDLPFVRSLDRAAWRVLERAALSGLNAPLTSSAGRLFDAIAGLLGLRQHASFEGQAAMELEALAEREADSVYSTEIVETEGTLVVRTTDVVRGVVSDLLSEVPAPRIAARFHGTLADVIARVCERIRARTAVSAVALSGGVFQNAWLLDASISALEARGFEVYTHGRVPPNDGGLALGQAAIAARRWAG